MQRQTNAKSIKCRLENKQNEECSSENLRNHGSQKLSDSLTLIFPFNIHNFKFNKHFAKTIY
jgi:hypothetical protein